MGRFGIYFFFGGRTNRLDDGLRREERWLGVSFTEMRNSREEQTPVCGLESSWKIKNSVWMC